MRDCDGETNERKSWGRLLSGLGLPVSETKKIPSCPPFFYKLFPDPQTAWFFAQVFFVWSTTQDSEGWIWHTSEQFEYEVGLSRDQQERIRAWLSADEAGNGIGAFVVEKLRYSAAAERVLTHFQVCMPTLQSATEYCIANHAEYRNRLRRTPPPPKRKQPRKPKAIPGNSESLQQTKSDSEKVGIGTETDSGKLGFTDSVKGGILPNREESLEQSLQSKQSTPANASRCCLKEQPTKAEVDAVVGPLLESVPDRFHSELIDRLVKLGMVLSTAEKLVASKPDVVERQLEFLPQRGDINNKPGFLVKAITEDFEPPKSDHQDYHVAPTYKPFVQDRVDSDPDTVRRILAETRRAMEANEKERAARQAREALDKAERQKQRNTERLKVKAVEQEFRERRKAT